MYYYYDYIRMQKMGWKSENDIDYNKVNTPELKM